MSKLGAVEMVNPAWKIRADALAEMGEREQASVVLLEAANAGNVEALVRLATMQFMSGDFVAADTTIRSAALKVRDDDFETHWQFHVAYTLGVGEIDTLERWRLAFEHLRIAATLEAHPMLLVAVASHYAHGLNGVPADLTEAEAWYERAIDAGSAEARVAYKRLLKRKGVRRVRVRRGA